MTDPTLEATLAKGLKSLTGLQGVLGVVVRVGVPEGHEGEPGVLRYGGHQSLLDSGVILASHHSLGFIRVHIEDNISILVDRYVVRQGSHQVLADIAVALAPKHNVVKSIRRALRRAGRYLGALEPATIAAGCADDPLTPDPN